MENDKANAVLEAYDVLLAVDYAKVRHDFAAFDWQVPPSRRSLLEHARWMCGEAFLFPPEKIKKKMRWLGHIQGLMLATGFRGLDQLKKDSMPPEEKVDG